MVSVNIQDKIKNLWQLVGNTPMIRIAYQYRDGKEQSILVKCEHYNMTGSIKDRTALYVLQKAYELETISRGDTIVEVTSGNTGISFAAIGKALGHPVNIITPDLLSSERKEIFKSMGATVKLISKEQGGFVGSINIAEMMQHNGPIFLPRQFENSYNVEAHEKTTGREIGHQLLLDRVKPYAFVAGVGTGGTIMGVGKYLRTLYPEIRLHPLEPAESQTLTTGYQNGQHRIQGMSDEFIPNLLDLESLDKIIQVNDGDAILMAQKLSKGLGLEVGISSGANFLGAIKVQLESKSERAVITVFPDSNKKYLSTDLMREEPIKAGFITPKITLLDFQPVNNKL